MLQELPLVMVAPILLPHHCRAARALLDLPQDELAAAADVSLSSVKRFEAGEVATRPAMLKAMRMALEDKGVIFVSDQIFDGEKIEGGILLKKKPAKRK